MKKKYLIVIVVFCVGLVGFQKADAKKLPGDKDFKSLLPQKTGNATSDRAADSIYGKLHLQAFGLKQDIFQNAYKGYSYLQSRGLLDRTGILTICDYSQSSHNKRLYVIDLNKGQVVFNTYVSHGRNSGGEYATSFSNMDNSNKSSCGFMVTGSTYSGRAGKSLHLNGMEPGINSNVYARNIVMHGSHYVNSERADEGAMMGRSLGCPAVPYGEHYAIIDYIKGGTCLYIATENPQYLAMSRIINSEITNHINTLAEKSENNDETSGGSL
ncbi:MAG: murein L,D-transpeptidase catalytic domain family protein [Chitinophagaceae bacterium]